MNAVQAEEGTDAVTRLINHFSSWTHLKKMVGWILKFKSLLLCLSQKRKQLCVMFAQSGLEKDQQEREIKREMQNIKAQAASGSFSIEKLSKAEMEIISFCQRKRFPDEFNCLQRGGRVKRTSHIYKLNPVLENGVLRVGGRLSRAAMPEECKHPTILAKDLHISDIILRHIHQKVGHGGRNHMLSSLRQKYWIPGASVAIRRILSKCMVC